METIELYQYQAKHASRSQAHRPPGALLLALVHKKTIRLPGLKIEAKSTVGDHQPPKVKVRPFPGLNKPTVKK